MSDIRDQFLSACPEQALCTTPRRKNQNGTPTNAERHSRLPEQPVAVEGSVGVLRGTEGDPGHADGKAARFIQERTGKRVSQRGWVSSFRNLVGICGWTVSLVLDVELHFFFFFFRILLKAARKKKNPDDRREKMYTQCHHWKTI